MNETKPKRRWFRFSLRTMFVLVTIAGICSWVVRQMIWIHHRHSFLEQSDILYFVDLPGVSPIPGPWSLRPFGETSPSGLRVPPAKLDRARALFPEAQIIDRSTGRVIP